MKNRFIVILIIVLSFSSCKKNNQEQSVSVINVSFSNMKESVNLSDFGSSTLVSLETNDSALIGNIAKIITTKNNIYISDNNSLFEFSSDGKYLGKISKQGNGPGEYISISDFQINQDGNAWILSKTNKHLNLYSWNNETLEQIPLDRCVSNILLKDKNKMIIYTGNETDETNKCQISYLDLRKRKVTNSFLPIDEHKATFLFVNSPTLFFKTKSNDLLFYESFNDTIYGIQTSGVKSKYVINWDRHNIPQTFFSKDFSNIMDFFTEVQKNNFAYGCSFFMETKKNYLISFFYQKKNSWVIKSKDSGDCMVFNQLKIDDSLCDFPIDLTDNLCFAQDDGSIIIPLSVDTIKDFYDNITDNTMKEKLEKTIHFESENQNPVILIIKSSE